MHASVLILLELKTLSGKNFTKHDATNASLPSVLELETPVGIFSEDEESSCAFDNDDCISWIGSGRCRPEARSQNSSRTLALC